MLMLTIKKNKITDQLGHIIVLLIDGIPIRVRGGHDFVIRMLFPPHLPELIVEKHFDV